MSNIRLTVAIPTTGTVKMGFTYSLVGMFSFMASRGIPSLPEQTLDVTMDVNESSSIHTNRELLVRRAIDTNRTHLLFVDDDMVFEPNCIDMLFRWRQPVVATNYAIKTSPISFVAVGLDGNRIATTQYSQGLVPVAYTGFGLSLFAIDVFRHIPQPWFQPEFCQAEGIYTTEDNPCYRKIRESGVPVYIDQEASRLVKHIGLKSYTWQEFNDGSHNG